MRLTISIPKSSAWDIFLAFLINIVSVKTVHVCLFHLLHIILCFFTNLTTRKWKKWIIENIKKFNNLREQISNLYMKTSYFNDLTPRGAEFHLLSTPSISRSVVVPFRSTPCNTLNLTTGKLQWYSYCLLYIYYHTYDFIERDRIRTLSIL